jgi:SAM-dependent methyltransferase/mannose-6-phosphate isomerase-like protein (cupin superfamily)
MLRKKIRKEPMRGAAPPRVHLLPACASFRGVGLKGFEFGDLEQKDLQICYVEVEAGHDTFMISRKIARLYYILTGSGSFTIADQCYKVNPGMLVEVPPRVEYSYSGRLGLLLISRPAWFMGNDVHTKWNPDVVTGNSAPTSGVRSWAERLVAWKVFGKSPLSAFLRINGAVWRRIPAPVTARDPVASYGRLLHKLVRLQGARGQLFHTFFLRNRAFLELIRRVVAGYGPTGTLRVAVLGCSAGAEAYSVAWRIRSAQPELNLAMQAVDISKQAVEVGERGEYSVVESEFTGSDLFDRMTESEIAELFDRVGEKLIVKPWIRHGITWRVSDVGEPSVLDLLGPQDIVIANNFLCHMDPATAERCLRNIARLVRPSGYLFVSGIDLEVRTRVAADLNWIPLRELLEEVHEGDPRMRRNWPFNYSSLEPLDKKRRDWLLRYATAFQVGGSGAADARCDGGFSPNHGALQPEDDVAA